MNLVENIHPVLLSMYNITILRSSKTERYKESETAK